MLFGVVIITLKYGLEFAAASSDAVEKAGEAESYITLLYAKNATLYSILRINQYSV